MDDKSRVIVPIKWRETLGTKVFLVRSLDGTNCIWGFSEAEFDRFSDQLQRGVSMGDLEGLDQLRYVQSSLAEVEVDKQGRIPVPAKLRDHAVIAAPQEGQRGANVKVVGMFTWFEIWNPEKYTERLARTQTETLLKKLDKAREPRLE